MCCGQTDGRKDNVKTVYPPQAQFAGGIKIFFWFGVGGGGGVGEVPKYILCILQNSQVNQVI